MMQQMESKEAAIKAQPMKGLWGVLRSFVGAGGRPCPNDLEAAAPDLDWDAVLEYSRRQFVAPYLALELHRQGILENLAQNVRDRWLGILASSAWENRVKYLEFQKVNRLFDKAGIAVMPLKGLALSEILFEADGPKVRTMSDLDLLFRGDDLRKARKILAEEDYHPYPNAYAWYDEMRAEAFGRMNVKKADLKVDLQWAPRFFIDGKFVEWGASGAWQRAVHAPHLGSRVWLPALQDHLCFLLLQMAHDWDGGQLCLRQLADGACLIQRFGLRRDDCFKMIPPLTVGQTERLKTLWLAVEECFLGDKDPGLFLPATLKLLQSLFDPPVERDHFYGPLVLKAPINPFLKMKFLLGYFFPSRDYLERSYGRGFLKVVLLGYPRHLGALLFKALRFLRFMCYHFDITRRNGSWAIF